MVDQSNMHYLKIKRQRTGHCNICGNLASLTWDHVPPQGGVELTPVQMESVFAKLSGTHEGFKGIQSQNGVKFTTICKSCNEMMGHKYDIAINEFALSVGRYLRSQLIFPAIIQHKTRPGALIRGILGHLISAKLHPDEAIFDKLAASLVLNDSMPIPDDIHIFYWIFPYDSSCIVRDVAIALLTDPSQTIQYCQFIKYFPIAYLVSNRPAYDDLEELTQFRDAAINDEISIPIRLREVKPLHWPEMVDDARVILGGESMMNAVFASRKTGRPARRTRPSRA